MAAKILLLRPNAAALYPIASRSRDVPLPRPAPSRARACYNLSSGRSLFTEGLPYSCLASPMRRNFCIRATADCGKQSSLDAPLMESMEKKIKEHLSADLVVVKDAHGNGRYVSIDVISSAFEGKSEVDRQRMVYKAICEELQDRVHAVDEMITRTPSEAAASADS